MIYACTEKTDLDDLIGTETADAAGYGFHYGPLSMAMKQGEELVLENSGALSLLTRAKLAMLVNALFIEDTAESLHASGAFRVVLR